MIEIDGAAGGGQLLRTTLALSVITGEAVSISDIRGARETPGLRPQHLAAVRLLAEVSNAEVSEVDVGSTRLEFDPGHPQPGTYEATIGTAGSITLLFDTVLPIATVLDAPVTVDARGGTDVKWSPPMDFLRLVKLPLLRRHGLQAAVDVDRWGFYPEGGGAARLHLAPSTLTPIELDRGGAITGVRVYSKCSRSLADSDVADRQRRAAVERLVDRELPVVEETVAIAETRSPGSAIVLRLESGAALAGFDALGERGKPAEDVGEEAADRALEFLDGGGAVDSHLADQLLVFLALGAGSIPIPAVTDHIDTSLGLVEAFDQPVTLVEEPDGPGLRSG